MLLIKTCFSAGLVFLSIAAFPWISIVGSPLAGLAATFGFAPAWPFHVVFYYSHLVSVPSYFLWIAAVLFTPACFVLRRIDNAGKRLFLKAVAICSAVAGFIPFLVFCVVYFQYGTALAPNSPERESVVMSFVPTGAVGAMLLLQSAVLAWGIKWLGKGTSGKLSTARC